jgi:putative selenium metabolism hydrolase
VADGCSISIDRRLTAGETWEKALDEIRDLPSCKAHNAQVSMHSYDKPSHTGLSYPTECYFPAWITPKEHPAAQAVIMAHKELYGDPVVGKWTFSTNGVSIMGRHNIPCVGFGPGKESQAHAPDEITWKDDLVKCAAVYAAVPAMLAKA